MLFAALIPVTAYAGNCTVSTYSNYNYFVTFGSDGTWKGIKTPNHNIVETGAVAYCLQPANDTPSNSGYTEGAGGSAYDETTRLGIQAILENGYPNYNGGFPDGEARYATANAIRFWVAERGCDGALDWMDLTRFSQFFRGASGYEDLYDWCMYLLNCARIEIYFNFVFQYVIVGKNVLFFLEKSRYNIMTYNYVNKHNELYGNT